MGEDWLARHPEQEQIAQRLMQEKRFSQIAGIDVPHRSSEIAAERLGLEQMPETQRQRMTLHREFDRAFETTKLPDRLDYEWANELLIKARRSMGVSG